ncbi:MAG: hypothetical protein GY810_24760 [Aureispira sp.]|nr:hypothetical protein [Aureispira sp.]
MRSLAILLIVSCFFSCGTDYSSYTFTKVEYHYHDGSVAPPIYRSYIIQTERDHLHFEVSDYEGVRLDTIFPLSSKQFEKLIKLSHNQSDKGTESGANENGGSTQELYFYDATGLISDYIWNEGKSSSLEAIIVHLKSLIPNFEETLHFRNKRVASAADVHN